MVRLGLVVRLLMVVACLVPFASPRPASAGVPTPVPAAPIGGQEDDTEREEEVAAEEALRTPHQPLPSRASAVSRLDAPAQRPTTSPVRAPAPVDPFRNGLGSPYRC